ncbi:hypothetical protein ACFQJD_14440 [Haloplanus sp. GCM10025708]|uniref:hypothetical protein n=1 Tax=Haloferacaceae TaxID=1644056 RepID=UPI00360B0FD6
MSTETRRNGRNVRFPPLTRYDLLLFVLPLPLFAGVVASLLGPVSSSVSVGVSALPSLLLLGYALFVAAPSIEKKRR